jgi:hypothetical protein
VVIRFGHDWDPTCMVMDEVGLLNHIIGNHHTRIFILTRVFDVLWRRHCHEWQRR